MWTGAQGSQTEPFNNQLRWRSRMVTTDVNTDSQFLKEKKSEFCVVQRPWCVIFTTALQEWSSVVRGVQTMLAVCDPCVSVRCRRRMTDVFHFRSNTVPGRVARETEMCEMSWGARGQSKEDWLYSSACHTVALFAFLVPVSNCPDGSMLLLWFYYWGFECLSLRCGMCGLKLFICTLQMCN